MCNDILVIGPSDGVVCENKDFLNWLEQAQKRSLVKFQMSSKQPSFARMPRNRGHLEQFCSSILSTHINMLLYQLASYTVDLASRLVHCTGRTKILPNALHFSVFAHTNYLLSILLGNWYFIYSAICILFGKWYFTQQQAFYLEFYSAIFKTSTKFSACTRHN